MTIQGAGDDTRSGAALLPPGHRLRAPDQADAAAVAALITSAEAAVGETQPTEAADLLEVWREIDAAADAWLVEAAGGALVAYADLTPAAGAVALDPYVSPGAVGGLRQALLIEGERRAAGRAAILRCSVLAQDMRWRRLLERAGFALVRHFLRMTMPLPAGRAPSWPPGVRAAPLEPALEAGAHAVYEEAFAGAWGHRSEELGAWRERYLTGEGCDRSLSLVALDGEEVAGVALNTHRFGGGFVSELAVRPSQRRRGLGLALLLASAAEFALRGERRLVLLVDAANPTGALRLYRRAGMEVEWEAVVYEKPLAG